MATAPRQSEREKGEREVSYTILGNVFKVDPRYKDLKAVGKGSYGIVCSALDTRCDKRVAIKKITPMAQQTVDAKHVLREIRLMRYLGVHPNIISLEVSASLENLCTVNCSALIAAFLQQCAEKQHCSCWHSFPHNYLRK
jgi:serine/threonine protein kinase